MARGYPSLIGAVSERVVGCEHGHIESFPAPGHPEIELTSVRASKGGGARLNELFEALVAARLQMWDIEVVSDDGDRIILDMDIEGEPGAIAAVAARIGWDVE